MLKKKILKINKEKLTKKMLKISVIKKKSDLNTPML